MPVSHPRRRRFPLLAPFSFDPLVFVFLSLVFPMGNVVTFQSLWKPGRIEMGIHPLPILSLPYFLPWPAGVPLAASLRHVFDSYSSSLPLSLSLRSAIVPLALPSFFNPTGMPARAVLLVSLLTLPASSRPVSLV